MIDLAIEIHRVSANRSWVVRIQVSTDGGETYTDLADGKGNNPDGRPNVYSETIAGVAFTSLIYSTVGIPDGSVVVVLIIQLMESQQQLPTLLQIAKHLSFHLWKF